MKILVYDIAAEHGGALTILKMFYERALADKDNEWVFLVYKKEYLPDDSDRIKTYEYSFPKKSWIHRLIFDKFKIGKIIKGFNPDLIYNLQNVYVKAGGIKQTIYLHQPLPFTNIKISVFNFIPWLYKHVIGRMIYKSVKKADHIIVQTNWMKQALLDRKLCGSDKVTVEGVRLNLDGAKKYSKQKDPCFFFPANHERYKNHMVILKALTKLKDEGINYKLICTINGNEDRHARKLAKYSKKHGLNVDWHGRMPREEVLELYSKTILLFPSLLETYGLPLKEASMLGAPVIAASTPFAKEILENYDNALFFKGTSSVELAKLMKLEYRKESL